MSERDKTCVLRKPNYFIQNCLRFIAETPRIRAERMSGASCEDIISLAIASDKTLTQE